MCIKADVHIKTGLKLVHDKPDIVINDKMRNEIMIVKVGIFSIENLQKMEIARARKYASLTGS